MNRVFAWSTLFCLAACTNVRVEKCGIQVAGVSCGSIHVPLDYERPNAPKLEFHFLRVQPNVTTGSTPLVILTGGPGGSIVDSIDASALRVISVLKRPVIVVDYRGTGRSSVLVCSGLQNSNLTLPLTALQSELCMTEIGPSTLYYSSVSIARDIDVLRRELNFNKIDLAGFSYGTIVLQTYSSLFPATVRAAVLDSPLPLKRDVFDGKYWAAYARIYNIRDGVDGTELRRNLAIILRRLRESEALQSRTQVTPELLANVYRTTSKELPNALAVAIKTSNYSLLRNLAEDFTRPIPGGPARLFSVAAFISIFCNDVVRYVPWVRSDPSDVRRRKAETAVSRLPRDTFAPFLPEEAVSRFNLNICSGFPFVQKMPPMLNAPEGIETLTLYGEEDDITPIENIPDMPSVYKTRVAIIPKVGHDVLLSNLCSVRLAGEFLATRNVVNITACS